MDKPDKSRYRYDEWLALHIASVLHMNKGLTSNQLRQKVRQQVSDSKENMRKQKREKDNNSGYSPSESKITVTIEQLIEWNWVERKEASKNSVTGKGLPKVYYSLTDLARFCGFNGILPSESYMLSDLYQMILRTAATGIYQTVWDQQMKINRLSRTLGTSVEDIYLRKDVMRMANFTHQKYLRKEVEYVFDDMIKRDIIRRELINNEIRYIINPLLKEFIETAWEYLYFRTLRLAWYTFILNGLKKDLNYKNLYKWLISLNSKDYVENILIECRKEKGKYNKKKFNQTLLFVKKRLIDVEQTKGDLIASYEKDIEKVSPQDLIKTKKSVLFYVCPDFLIESVKNVVKLKSNK